MPKRIAALLAALLLLSLLTLSAFADSSTENTSDSDTSPAEEQAEGEDTPAAAPAVRAENIVDETTAVTYELLCASVQGLAENYPEIITTGSIGTSVMGREIPYLTLGTGETELLFVGGMHAREHITVAWLLQWVEDYAAAWASEDGMLGDYNIRSLLSDFTIWIVPNCNPDGTESVLLDAEVAFTDKVYRGSMKANANGVNLNTNFPFLWEEGTIPKAKPDEAGYKGSSAGSEPETQALMALCEAHSFEALLSMHIKGKTIYWRDKTNDIVPGDAILAQTVAENGDFNLAHRSWDRSVYCGGFENWFRYATGKPGLCVELMRYVWDEAVTSPTYTNFALMTDYAETKYIAAAVMELVRSPRYAGSLAAARAQIVLRNGDIADEEVPRVLIKPEVSDIIPW